MHDGIINQKNVLHLPRRAGRFLATLLVLTCLINTLFVPATRAAELVQVTLNVKQLFVTDGLSTPPSDVFTYRFTSQTPNAPMPSGSEAGEYIFTIADTRDREIGPISFHASGVYIYELRCITDHRPNYTIDQSVYTIEVHVLNSQEALVIIYGSEHAKVSELLFTHSYGTLPNDPAVVVDPPVQKIVRGNPSTDSTFTFQLSAENPSNPMPIGSTNGVKTMTIIGEGEAEFGIWAYTRAGTYRYTISEVNTGIAGYTYDTTVYTITDLVTAVDEQLVVSRTIADNRGTQVSSISFVNTYTPPSAPIPSDDRPPDRPAPPDGGSPNRPAPPDSGSPNTPGKPGDGPKTGDNSNPALWITLIAISGVLLILLFIIGRKTSQARKRAAR